jgi:hypothetical protein
VKAAGAWKTGLLAKAVPIKKPYQTLINLYLRDCAETKRPPGWRESA